MRLRGGKGSIVSEWGTALHYRFGADGAVEVSDDLSSPVWEPFGKIEEQPQGYPHAGKLMLVVRTARGDVYQGRYATTAKRAVEGGLRDMYDQGVIL